MYKLKTQTIGCADGLDMDVGKKQKVTKTNKQKKNNLRRVRNDTELLA